MKPVNRMLSDNSIAIIEQQYKAEYVMDSCLKTVDGQWANFPAAFFYTEEKHPEGSNYMALYRDQFDRWTVTDGIRITEGTHNGFLVGDELVHSRYRHDFFAYNDVTVDGGRDYFRYGVNEGALDEGVKKVQFRVVDGNIVEVENNG